MYIGEKFDGMKQCFYRCLLLGFWGFFVLVFCWVFFFHVAVPGARTNFVNL